MPDQLMTASRFLTAQGVEVPALTAEEMREIDRVAVEETGPNLYQMMENAGRSLATIALDQIGLVPHGQIVVLAGTGGNGGGGICAARHLANRGLDVRLVVTEASRLDDVPAMQHRIFGFTSGMTQSPDDLAELSPSLIIDALVGYSLAGELRGAASDLAVWANGSDAPTLSLDVPSGVDATSGEVGASAVQADVTMTLALPKTGLDGHAVGSLFLADLGIPAETYSRAGVPVAPNIFDNSFIVAITPRSTG